MSTETLPFPVATIAAHILCPDCGANLSWDDAHYTFTCAARCEGPNDLTYSVQGWGGLAPRDVLPEWNEIAVCVRTPNGYVLGIQTYEMGE